MSWWPAKLFGIDPARIPQGADTQWVFTHAPSSWHVFILLAVAALVAYGVIALYRRETDEAPRRWKFTLAAVRIVILALILLILLGPALAISTHRTIEPVVIVLVDDSLSMNVRDRYPTPNDAAQAAAVMRTDAAAIQSAGVTRLQLIERMLTGDNQKLLHELTRRGQVRVMTFSRSVTLRQTLPAAGQRRGESIGPEGDGATSDASAASADTGGLPRAEPVPPLVANGQATDLAAAMRDAVRSVAGRPIAGIVVITDGQNTQGDDPRAAADELGSQSIPVYPIGVGDPSPPRNLRVVELWAPDSVFRDDPFLIQAQVAGEGFTDRTVNVEFTLKPVNADGTTGSAIVLDTKAVTFAGENDSQRIRLEYRPATAGDYILEARIAPQPDEVLDTDNTKSLPVKVLSNHARVLLVSGSPTWDYRLLAILLRRDKTIDLSCWLSTMDPDMQQEGNTVIEHLPRTAEDLFQYDLIIMMDPDPAEFDMHWIELLHKFLDQHAGGLMWVAGPKFTGRFLSAPATNSMRDLLPVEIGDLTALDIESLVMTHTQSWPLNVTPDGADSVMLRMDKDPKVNARLWDLMPGIYWSFPVRSARPGATVLLEHSDPRLRSRSGGMPLLVTGHIGPGRVVYMGFTGTWRWRKLGERYYDQFWIQAVRYLIEGRLLGDKKRGRISTDRDIYAIGSRVNITAQLFDNTFAPLTVDSISATLNGPGSSPTAEQLFTLKPVPNQPGQYQGSVIATQVGLNEISVTLPGVETVRLARQITIDLPRIEFADTRLNRNMLSELATKTEGRYVALDQIDELPAWLPQRSQTIVIPGQPIDLWDNSRMLLLLLALLTFEWAMRKRKKMM